MNAQDTINIPRETVLDATETLPEAQRGIIRALYERALEKKLGLRELADAIGYDRTTIHKIFSGTHGAGKTEFCDAAARWLKLEAERAGTERLDFVETDLAKKIWGAVDRARRYNKITFVFGESQIGKTASLEAYAARNPKDTVFVRMPSSPTLRLFVHLLSERLHAPKNASFAARREWIVSHVGENDVLVIDEAHQVFLTENRLNPTLAKIFEYIREIHDRTHCGITLVATNIFADEFTRDATMAKVMAQTQRRGLYAFRCPDNPSERDLARFAEAYNLPPITPEAKAIQDDVIENEKLGVWLTILRMGAATARNKKRAIDWDCVIAAKRSRDKLQGAIY